ncbi:unnamed protein product [Lactuca saligna]|uniref:Uncharacterized protein n=1 Tax=Lactuca saligna TaxID=75948 RepID=A0AA35YFR9_LACSI|nr:unnamed protein product [Lactuca saligna]
MLDLPEQSGKTEVREVHMIELKDLTFFTLYNFWGFGSHLAGGDEVGMELWLEAEEVDLVIQVDNVNIPEVDEFNPNAQVDNFNVQEVALVIQVQQVSVRPISEILKRIRRRKSERILKLKLGKTIGGVDDPGNSKGKTLVID